MMLRHVPTGAFATIALLVAGCGASPSPGPANTAQAGSPRDIASKAFQYAACMRSNGVSNFPDPKVSIGPGHASVGMIVSRSVVSSPRFQAAQKACRGIMPDPSPAQIAQQQRHEEQGKLAFARCMRARGVSGFPDPTLQGQITPAMLAKGGVDIHAPAVLAAAKSCVSASNGVITAADIQRAESGG
jgi:hypothetical protein